MGALVTEPKLFKHFRRAGVDPERMDFNLLYQLAGPGQVQTALQIVEAWMALKNKTPFNRMRAMQYILDYSGVYDLERRDQVYRAARYICINSRLHL